MQKFFGWFHKLNIFSKQVNQIIEIDMDENPIRSNRKVFVIKSDKLQTIRFRGNWLISFNFSLCRSEIVYTTGQRFIAQKIIFKNFRKISKAQVCESIDEILVFFNKY